MNLGEACLAFLGELSEAQCIAMDLMFKLWPFFFCQTLCSPSLECLQDVSPSLRSLGDFIGWLNGERRIEVFYIWSILFVISLETSWHLW